MGFVCAWMGTLGSRSSPFLQLLSMRCCRMYDDFQEWTARPGREHLLRRAASHSEMPEQSESCHGELVTAVAHTGWQVDCTSTPPSYTFMMAKGARQALWKPFRLQVLASPSASSRPLSCFSNHKLHIWTCGWCWRRAMIGVGVQRCARSTCWEASAMKPEPRQHLDGHFLNKN